MTGSGDWGGFGAGPEGPRDGGSGENLYGAPAPGPAAATPAAAATPGAGGWDRSWGPTTAPEAEESPYRPEVPAPPVRRRRRAIGLIGAAAVLVLAAVAIVLGHTGGAPTVQATVAASVNRAIAARTAAVQVSMVIGAASQTVTATGGGVADFSQGAMALSLEMSIGSRTVPVKGVYEGRTVYEEIPGLDQLEPGKEWLSIDIAGAGSSGIGGVGEEEGNPMAMLALLAQKGATVTATGATTIQGIQVEGYQVTIPTEVMQREMTSAKLPSWISAAIKDTTLSGVTESVYIDRAKQLRRAVIALSVAVKGQTANVNETLDFSDYGTPTSISVPPAGDTIAFEQFLKDAAAHRALSAGT